MVYICKNGRIFGAEGQKKGVPAFSVDVIRGFVKENEYKGSISVPDGPYNSDTATHISRSLELLEAYGDLERISTIVIEENGLSVRLKPHVISDKPLTLDSNLKQVVKDYKKTHFKNTKIS